MADVRKFMELKSAVERWKKERDKAEGAFSQLMSVLQKDFGCGSLEEAEKKISEMMNELESVSREFEESLASFETKWGDKLREFGYGVG